MQGIGAVEKVRLGYFDLEKKEYITKDIDGEWELLNVIGNITWDEDEPVIHIHTVLGGENLNTIGGHLLNATIAVTGEFHLITGEKTIGRKLDDETGLKLINL